MSESISNEDVARIVFLLSDLMENRHLEIRELRRRFLNGLSLLISSPHWTWAHSVMDPVGRPAYFNIIFSDAYTPEQIDLMTATSNDPRYLDVTQKAMGGAWGRQHRTMAREVFQPDIYWNDPEHPIGKLKAVGGVVDILWSLYPLSDRGISGLGFHRYTGEEKFTERERNIVHVVLGQVDWLHREGTSVPAAEHITELTARQREVLLHLMSGASVKQIAQRMNLSDHTVRGHTKDLHRVFRVQSRGELLSKFLAGKTAG